MAGCGGEVVKESLMPLPCNIIIIILVIIGIIIFFALIRVEKGVNSFGNTIF